MRSLSFLLLVVAAMNGETKQVTCGTCHVKESATQPSTAMAHALPSAPTIPDKLTFQSGRFSYAVETKGNQATYNVSDGERTLSLPLRWVFGAGAQTYVLTYAGDYFESTVSYYPEIGKLDFTLGDEHLNPQRLEDAIGRKLAISEVTSCFGCHSTHGVTNHKMSLAALTPGVQCERCHTEAPEHLKSMGKVVPVKLGSRSAESISTFCGQCHRTWETVVRNNWRGEMNVRFQPYRLASSQCFNGTDARISCLACHNPHEDLVTESAQYDAKCLACHAGAAGTKKCTVSQTNCTTCHMPKVKLPGGHQTFTDHNIRVVKAGDGYPN